MLVVDPIKTFLSPALQLKEGKRSGRLINPCRFIVKLNEGILRCVP
jgi:hypothetical protein